MHFIIVTQLFATLLMTGLILFVQIVHYPLFALVSDKSDYHREHQRRTGYVVVPLMGLEALSAAYLLLQRGSSVDIVGGALLAVIWLSTAFLQVPCHMRLLKNPSPQVVSRLVITNWIRTVAWLLRSLLLLATLLPCP